MTKRNPRYTDKFRTNAVLMLEAAGYPDKKGALVSVSKQCQVPYQTLSRWYRNKNNPPPTKLVHEKTFELKQAIRDELEAIFKEMGTARQDATYKDLAWAAGVLFDKNQILDDKPTAILKVKGLIDQGLITKEQAIEKWPSLEEEFFANA